MIGDDEIGGWEALLSAGRGGKEGGGGRERSWSGRRWPWKKMSSAGERSMVGEGIDVRALGVVR